MVILPDKGVRDRLSLEVMNSIISKMTQYLRKDEVRIAMETGLNDLIAELRPMASSGMDLNELSDKIIEEEGV